MIQMLMNQSQKTALEDLFGSDVLMTGVSESTNKPSDSQIQEGDRHSAEGFCHSLVPQTWAFSTLT